MKQLDLLSSAGKQGNVVTQIIHFSDGSKKTIEGIKTDTIRQGQFTQFETENERLVFVNDKNVNMIEVFRHGKDKES